MEARKELPNQPFGEQSKSQSENRRASLVGLRGKGLVTAGMAKFTRGGDEHDVLQASDAKKPGGGKTKFGASLFGPRKSVDSITAMREAAQQEDEREPSIHSSLEALPSVKKGNILARLLTRSTKKKTALSPSPSASSGSAASPVAGKQLFNKFDTAAAGPDGHESDGYESANSHPSTPKRHDADQQRGSDFQDASYSMDVSPGPHYADGIDITLTPGMIQQQRQAAQRRQADSSYECDPTQVLISKEMLGHGNLPMLSPALVGKESAPMDISPLPMQQQGPSPGFAFGQQAGSPQNDTPVLAAGGSPDAASGAQQEVERMLAATRPDASPEYTPAPSDTTMMDLDTPLTFTIAKTLQFRPDTHAAAQESRSLVASISQLLDAAAPTPKQEAAPAAAAAEPASPARTIPTMLQDSTAPGAFGSPNPVAAPASPMLQGTPVAPSPATALSSLLEPQVTLESELPGRANPPGSPATPATGIKQDISRNLSVGRLNSKLSKLSVMEGAASDAHEEQEEEGTQEADIAAAEAAEQEKQAAANAPAPEAGSAELAAVDVEEEAVPESDSMEHDGDLAQQAAPVDVADIDVQLAASPAPPTAEPSSSSKASSAMQPSSPFAEQVPAAVLAAAPPSPAAAELAPSEQVSSPTVSAAEGLASHAVSVELETMDSVQSAAAEPAPQAAAAEAPVLQAVEEQPSHENMAMAMDADEPEAAVEEQEPALAQGMQQGQAADGAVEAMDDFEELERQLLAEAEQQQPAGAAAAAQLAGSSPAAMQMTPDARTTAGSGLFSAGKRTGSDTPDFGSQAPQPARSTSPELQQAFGISAEAAGTCSPPAATSQPQRDMSSPGLLNLDASEDDLLHGMQELSRGSFADFALSGSQPMDLAMPERTPSPGAEHQREHHHRPTSAVRESIPLFTSSPMALDGGHAPSLDDEDMDLRQSRAVPQGLYASTAAYASNLETVQEAAYEGSMGSPTASSIISDGSISRKSSKAGSASPPGHHYHKSQGIGRSASKMGAGAATPTGQEQGSGRQQSSKTASALKKLASGKTPKTAPRASGIPTPGSGMGSGRRAAQHPPARTPTAAASSGYAGANVTPYTAGHQQQQHSASKTGPLHHNPDLQLSDMDTPTMGHSGMAGPSPTLPLDIRAAFGAAGGAAHGMRAAAAAAPSPSLVWQQDLHKTPIMAQMRNMPIEAAVNAPLLDSSPFPDDMDTRCLQEEARRLAIAMGEQATPGDGGADGMVPPGSDLRDDLHKRLMQKLAVQEEQMEGLRRHNEVLQEQLQTLQFASTSMQEGDEMEREARKYAEQQAEIFREKATDLDQRLHKQMAKTQDLFEANKEMANRLMRAEEESQFRLTELQTELDSMREERDELTMSTNTLTNGMQNLTVRIEELQAENNGLQEQVLSLQAAQHRQQQEVASLAEAKEQLTKRHEKALDSMITLETDNGKLNKQNQELAYKLKMASESSAATANWRHKYEEVQRQGALLHQKYQEKKALVERLMAELAAEKREKEDIFAICDQLLKEREAGKAQ